MPFHAMHDHFDFYLLADKDQYFSLLHLEQVKIPLSSNDFKFDVEEMLKMHKLVHFIEKEIFDRSPVEPSSVPLQPTSPSVSPPLVDVTSDAPLAISFGPTLPPPRKRLRSNSLDHEYNFVMNTPTIKKTTPRAKRVEPYSKLPTTGSPSKATRQQTAALIAEAAAKAAIPTSLQDQMLSFQAQLAAFSQDNEGLRQELQDTRSALAETQKALAEAYQQIAALQSAANSQSDLPLTQPEAIQNTDHDMAMPTDFPPLAKGIEASQYAHAYKPSGERVTFATIARRAPTRPSKRLSPRQVASVARQFIPVSTDQGFQYLYLPCRRKLPIRDMRQQFARLGLDRGRVLDIHYPDRNVVAILVHNEYASAASAVFEKHNIKPLHDFDPLDPT
ncbi:hypothetical protein CU098_002465, partial [Rhizopus stolonifer]